MENEVREEQSELKRHVKANDQTEEAEDEEEQNIFIDEMSDDENMAARMGVR